MPAGFTSYVARSFVPGKLSRLCILGVDLVGVPVLLVYGIPQSKTLAVIGWFGLRFALTGLCYLEYRYERRWKRQFPVNEPPASQRSPEPVSTTASHTSADELPNEETHPASKTPKADACEEQAPPEIAEPNGAPMHVEFPRTEPESLATLGDNGARTTRTISMSSVDSGTTTWSECQTPDQTAVELPVELEYAQDSLETPRPDEARWFSQCQDEALGTDTPKSVVSLKAGGAEDLGNVSENSTKSAADSPPLRRKRSKYNGLRPLVPRKSSASLHLSQVTFDKPEAFTS